MYATLITDGEEKLGFVLGEIPNSRSRCLSEPEIVPAVLFSIDENNIIVKAINSMGGYRYYHKHRGESGWITISNIEGDPSEAISNSRKYLCNINKMEEEKCQ